MVLQQQLMHTAGESYDRGRQAGNIRRQLRDERGRVELWSHACHLVQGKGAEKVRGTQGLNAEGQRAG